MALEDKAKAAGKILKVKLTVCNVTGDPKDQAEGKKSKASRSTSRYRRRKR